MPIYNLNNKKYNIPDEVVADFEKGYPDATIAYSAEGKIYDIPVAKKNAFLKRYPNASLYDENQQVEHQESSVNNVMSEGIGTQEDADSLFELNSARFKERNPYRKAALDVEFNKLEKRVKEKEADQFRNELEANGEIQRLENIKGRAQLDIDKASFFDRFFNPETRAAVAARDKAEEALETYQEANRNDDNWVEKNVGGVLRGIFDKVGDLRTWDFGASGVASAVALKDAVEKLDNGEELTPAEQNMLDAFGLSAAVQSAYQDKVGTAYNVGGSLPESASFMASLALNPAGGVGRKIAEKAAKSAVKKYGTTLVGKLAKGAARVGGDIVEMGVATAVPGAGRVAEDYYNRLNGQSTFDVDDNGLIRYGGQVEQEEADDAIWKAFGSQFIENYSEAMGNYFAPMGNILSNLTSKGLKAAHLGKVAEAISDISSSQWSKGIQRFKDAVKFDGLVGEYMEEVAGNVMNAATVGDMNFNSPDDPRSVFNPETNLETFLSCALMSGTMYAVEAPVTLYNKYIPKRNLRNADNAASELLGNRWEDLRNQIDEADLGHMAQILTGVENATDLSLEQKQAIKNYASKLVQYQAYNSRKVQDAQEATPEANEAENTYNEGTENTTHEYVFAANRAKVKAENALKQADESVYNALNEAMATGQPVEAFLNSLNGDVATLARDYYNKKLRVRGTLDAVKDKAEEEIARETKIIKSVSDPKTGIYAEVSRIDHDEQGNEVLVPGYITGWIGEGENRTPIFLEEGAENTQENRKPLKPSQYKAETIQEMPMDEVISVMTSMIRDKAAKQAEQEAKYAPDVLNAQMQQGIPFEDATAVYIPFQVTPEGNAWQVEVYNKDENGNQSKKPTRTDVITNDQFRDMLQAQYEANEAAQQQPVQEIAPTTETEVINTPVATEEVAQTEEVQPEVIAEEESKEPTLEEFVATLPKTNNNEIDYSALTPQQQFQYTSMTESPEVALEDLQADIAAGQAEIAKTQEQLAKATGGKRAELRDKARKLAATNAELQSFYDSVVPKQEATVAEEQPTETTLDESAANLKPQAPKADSEAKPKPKRRNIVSKKKVDSDFTYEELKPVNGVELAAEQLAAGNIKITIESYKKETGHGEKERKKMGLTPFRSLDKGGMSIERAAEKLVEEDEANHNGHIFNGDTMSARDAIIELLSMSEKWSDITDYIKNIRLDERKKREDAEYEEYAEYLMLNLGVTPEEYESLNEAEEQRIIALREVIEELDIIFAEAELERQQSIKEYEQGTNIAGNQGQSELLSEARVSNTGGNQGNERQRGTIEVGSEVERNSETSQAKESAEVAPSIEQTNVSRMADIEARILEIEGRRNEISDELEIVEDTDVMSIAELRAEEYELNQEQAELEAEYIGLRSMNDESNAISESEGSGLYFRTTTKNEEARRNPLRQRAKEWEQKLGVKVNIIENFDDVTNKDAKRAIRNGQRVTGWYEESTGEVCLYMPYLESAQEIDATYIHEVVAHKGLRGLLGDKFDEFLDDVWSAMSEADKLIYLTYPGVNGNKRAAADEYIAHLAENIDVTESAWGKLAELIKKFLKAIGLEPKMTNADIANTIKRSYQRLAEGGIAENAMEEDENRKEKTLFRTLKDKKELVAVHNISEDNLRKVLEVGGLIMPSIAITKYDMGHEGYGEISLLFDKETINPSDRRNKVYGGDAWTPRFPQTTAKINDKVSLKVYKKINGLIDNRALKDLYSLSAELHGDNIERTISDRGVEGYYNKEWMKLAYLLDNGKKVKVPMKMKDYGDMSETIIAMAKERGLKVSDIQQGGFDFYNNNKDFVEAIKNVVDERKLSSLPEDKRDVARKLFGEKEMKFASFDTLISAATRMEYDLEHGGLKQIIDKTALRETIEKKVKTNNADYNKWVDNLFDGIVEKYGIRNDRDWYTPSGNLKPWGQLYDDATPANILKHMLAEKEQGGSGGFFDSNIMGASAETYDSIEEIREKGKKRLRKLEDGEYDEWSNSVAERMSEICNGFLSPSQRKEFGAAIDSKIAITNAVAKDKTAKGIYKEMKRDYPGFTMEHAKKVEEIVKEIQDFAIGYFEAKPRRIVPLNEVRKAIVPKNTSKDVLDGLKDNGIEVATYKKGDEAARTRLIKKESDGIRFRTLPSMKLRKLEEGEKCNIERVFTQQKMFNFSSGEKIESYEDVAYIFKSLEDEAIENTFVALIKDGKPTIVHLGMGTANQSTLDQQAVIVAIDRIKPDEVYMVHNHPSGNLKASRQDVVLLDSMKKAYGSIVKDGIIINLRSGRYSVFNEEGSYAESNPSTPSKEIPVKTYSFSKRVFDEDFDIQELINVRSADDANYYAEKHGLVAALTSSQRLGDRDKISLLVIDQSGKIVGNVFLNYADVTPSNMTAISKDIAYYTSAMSGQFAIIFGRMNIKEAGYLNMVVQRVSAGSVKMFDAISVNKDGGYVSAANEGVMEEAVDYANNDTRFRIANKNQEIFVSNAQKAVEGIKQEKATPQQWLAMIEKNGGLKAGEDKWLGLSDWLKVSDTKTITKSEILDFINQNKIQIEEVKYGDWGNLDKRINSIRRDYTTEGLTNKQEIALVVPTIEPWNEDDEIHFGDAGEGRAIAWIRFGETAIPDKRLAEKSKMLGTEEWWNMSTEERNAFTDELMELKQNSRSTRVLVIDEIQSKRHQEGREKGYKDGFKSQLDAAESEWLKCDKAIMDKAREVAESLGMKKMDVYKDITAAALYRGRQKEFNDKRLEEIYGQVLSDEFHNLSENKFAAGKVIDGIKVKLYDSIPSAPFEKNWHELAMKRMLRYAAENGFDKVAWTTGAQQAERYYMSKSIDSILCEDETISEFADGTPIAKAFVLTTSGGMDIRINADKDGMIRGGEYAGHNISDVVGKELAGKMMQPGNFTISGEGLHIGGEGMKGFYDKMLPSFVNKYVKKWGTKVQDIELPELEEAGHIMHSVDVTDAMKESVMEGQTMFRIAPQEDVQAKVDKFTSKYNGKEVVVLNSTVSDEEFESLGLDVEDVREAIEKETEGFYDPITDKIYIFADIADADELEKTLFHENGHGIFRKNKKFVNEFNENSKDKFKKGREDIAKYYKEHERAEELFVRIFDQELTSGNFEYLPKYLSEELWNEFNDILKDFGYDRQEESDRRRKGSVVRTETDRGSEKEAFVRNSSIEPNQREERKEKGRSKEQAERLKKLFDDVADMGLRGVLGNTNYDLAMLDIFYALPEKERTDVAVRAVKIGGDVAVAVDEFLNNVEEPTLLEKVIASITNALRKVGINVELTENDVKYLLWRSRKPLNRNSIFDMAEDIDMRRKLKVGKFDNDPTDGGDTPGGGTRFRSSDNTLEQIKQARKEIEGNPSESQKEAGNYKKGHITLDSFDITLENPKGGVRSGVDKNGKKWSITMNNDYGYIRGTEAVDGDHIDVFLSDNPTEGNVFVVDQSNEDGSFDESKVMYGFNSLDEAREAYLSNYEKGWERRIMAITGVSKDEFKKWIDSSHKKTKAFSEYKNVNPEKNDIRFKVAKEQIDIADERTEIIKKYDKELESKKFNFQEAFQDRMLSLKVLMDLIENETGKKAKSFEDAYTAENQLGSINRPAQLKWLDEFYKPLLEELNKLSKKYGQKEIERYIYCKSGLERNEVLRQRDADETFEAAKAELDEKLAKNQIDQAQYQILIQQADDERKKTLATDTDYSGIRGLLMNTRADDLYDQYVRGVITKAKYKKEVADLKKNEEKVIKDWKQFAENQVANIENKAEKAELDALWDNINAATNETLRIDFESGMIDRDTYNAEKKMMKYYVPLRNWENTTAEEMYEYRHDMTQAVSSNQKRAKGRKSQADNPIATIALMAQNAIVRGNRNKMKQKLYSFVANRETSLASVRNVWYVRNANNQWEPQYADTSKAKTEAEIKQIMEQFELDMQKLEAQGDAFKGKMKQGMNYRANRKQKDEHVVTVMINGKEYGVYINGNPRAAQAVNGLTNAEGIDDAGKWIDNLKRYYGAGLTSWNPDFIIPNLVRDSIHAATMTFLDKGTLAAAKYIWNTPKVFSQVFKEVSGVGVNDPKLHQYFEEFVTNGGETGYTAIHTLEDYKKEYDKLMNEAKGVKASMKNGLKEGISKLSSILEAANRIAEDVNRFNAYVTSREEGYDIVKSIDAAKNITVNFNRKGALASNTTTFGKVASLMSRWILFFNPGVQGIYQLVTKSKLNPKRAKAIGATILASGFFMPMINELLVAAAGGDDEDDYWNQTDFKRRNNWMIFTGDGYVTIPLPPVLRELYGIGDIMYGIMTGHINPSKAIYDTLKQIQSAVGFVNLLPEVSHEPDMITYVKGFAPDVAAPILDIVTNTNFMGSPIAKWTDYNEFDPEYMRVYKGVSPVWKELSMLLNEVGGEEGLRSNVWGNFINPAMMEHLFTSYTGGIGKTINNVVGMALDDKENIDLFRKTPILPRFYTPNDEKTVQPAINRKYYDFNYEYNRYSKALKKYEKAIESGEHPEWQKHIDEMEKDRIIEFINYFKAESKVLKKLTDKLKVDSQNKELESDVYDKKAEIATNSFRILRGN